MSPRDLIDPESCISLDAFLEALPGGFNAIPDLQARRATASAVLASLEIPPNPRVTHEDISIAGPEGAPEVTVRVYRPVGASGPLPGIYYIHGGGMVLGDLDDENPAAELLCEQVGAIVVSVDYRLAPEHPYPAAVEDCYSGLEWLSKNVAELGVDAQRLAIYGASAGGGLTLATALLARDRGGPELSFMMPIYPMIDDRHETASSRAITDIGVWDRAGNVEAWEWYLGGQEADQYAAPARAADLSGLPPAFMDVGTVDLFLDEDLAFAQRLMQAGVPVELHVHPGAFHATELVAPQSVLSQRIWAMRIDALRRALA